jgi:hypothetical protein
MITIYMHWRRKVEETLLFRRVSQEVIHQLILQVTEDGCTLIHTLSGRWNETQRLFLSNQHLHTLQQQWETIVEGKRETIILADSLCQEDPSFEIVHLTRALHGGKDLLSLYRATPEGVEECTLTQEDLRQVMNLGLKTEAC